MREANNHSWGTHYDQRRGKRKAIIWSYSWL